MWRDAGDQLLLQPFRIFFHEHFKAEQDCLDLFDGTLDDGQHFGLLVFFVAFRTAHVNISGGPSISSFAFPFLFQKALKPLESSSL